MNNPDTLPLLLTVKQAAKEMSVSIRHFRDYIMPELDPINVSPAGKKRPTWRIKRDSLFKFIRHHSNSQ